MTSRLRIFSETEPLRSVVIGLADNFHVVAPEAVNETQRRYYGTGQHPRRERIIEEYATFARCLGAFGVEVLRPVPVAGVPDQLSPRDIGFVIGETLVVSQMVWPSRHMEWRGLTDILASLTDRDVIRAPEGALIEGGDVIVDHGNVYVGLGQRTSVRGLEFIRAHFREFEIHGIELRRLDEREDVVHLDCVFMPVGKESALIYRNGFRHLPSVITNNYDLIDVTRDEQQQLAVNVLSVSDGAVISQRGYDRVNREMRRRRIEVVEIDFSETIKTGGSFHCGTLTLRRVEK